MSRLRKGGAIAVVCTGFVGGFEGLRQTAYPDPATRGKPWTICYGETSSVQKGDHRSIAECKAGLLKGLDGYGDKVDACLKVPVPDTRWIALVSLAWNIGPAGVCRSSVVRLINAGQVKAGCDAFMHFNRAAGVTFPGLTRRRAAERELCLQGENL